MKFIVVANWKMNPATWREAKRLFEATQKAGNRAKHVSLVVAPPAVYLKSLRSIYKGRTLAFAAQNAHDETGGAYTGEISMAQARDCGAAYVIVGHAERRGAGETNEMTGRKIAAALAEKLIPIFCVGEEVRSASGEHFRVVREQLRAGFSPIEPSQIKNVIVVYEPLWTIGKETAMSPRDMHEMGIFIRKSIVEVKGESGMQVRILYGGSVDPTNAGAMLRDGHVHGLLVGRASEDAARIAPLLEAIEQSK